MLADRQVEVRRERRAWPRLVSVDVPEDGAEHGGGGAADLDRPRAAAHVREHGAEVRAARREQSPVRGDGLARRLHAQAAGSLRTCTRPRLSLCELP